MREEDIARDELPRVIARLEGRRVELTLPEAGTTGLVVTVDGHLTDYSEQRKNGELHRLGFNIRPVRDGNHPKSRVILEPSFVRSARWTFHPEDEIATLVITTTKVTLHLTVDGGYVGRRRGDAPTT